MVYACIKNVRITMKRTNAIPTDLIHSHAVLLVDPLAGSFFLSRRTVDDFTRFSLPSSKSDCNRTPEYPTVDTHGQQQGYTSP